MRRKPRQGVPRRRRWFLFSFPPSCGLAQSTEDFLKERLSLVGQPAAMPGAIRFDVPPMQSHRVRGDLEEESGGVARVSMRAAPLAFELLVDAGTIDGEADVDQ